MQKLAWTTLGIVGIAALAACGDDTEGSGGSGQGGAGGGATTTTSTSSSDGGGGSTSDGGGGSTSDGGGGAGGGEGGGSEASAWVRFTNSAGAEYVADLLATSDGGVVLVAYFTDTTNLGGSDLVSAGSGDLAIAKFAEDGTHVWSKRLGGAGTDFPQKAALGPNDEIYVTGRTSGAVDFGGGTLTPAGTDAFLASYAADGSYRWAKLLGGATNNDEGLALATNAAGTVVLSGTFGGTVDFGGGALVANGTDGFVAAFDSAGAHELSLRIDDGSASPDTAYPSDVAIDALGDVYVVGSFNGTLTPGALSSAGGRDVFLLKLDDSAQLVWAKRFGSAGLEFGQTVDLDGLGNLLITGNLSGAADFGGGLLSSQQAGFADVFVARFDDEGNHLSSRAFGDVDDQFVGDVVVAADGSTLIGGWTQGDVTVDGVTLVSPGFVQNSFWILLDPMNTAVAGAIYTSSPESNQLRGVALGPNETVYVGGNYASPLSFAGETLPTVDFSSAYWARQPITP